MLRPVRRNTVDFLGMQDSIRDHGLFNGISVRLDPEDDMYEIIDGVYRYTICSELGKQTMPCIVKQMTDDEVLAAQVQANSIRPETKPVEFAKQLRRLQRYYPDITLAEMAYMVKKSPTWVQNQLWLLHLTKAVQAQVDAGEITLCNAYELAKIPKSFQKDYVEQAKSMRAAPFRHMMVGIKRKLVTAAKQGNLEYWFNDDEWEPTPNLRFLREVIRELNDKEAAAEELMMNDAKTPLDGWLLALKWVAKLDAKSVEHERQKAIRRNKTSTVERESYVTEIDLDVPFEDDDE